MNQKFQGMVITVVVLLAGVGASELIGEAWAGNVRADIADTIVEGSWNCYVVDRFPDMQAAASWKGAVAYREGLNVVAADAPAGTIITANYPVSSFGGGQVGGAPMLCVKR